MFGGEAWGAGLQGQQKHATKGSCYRLVWGMSSGAASQCSSLLGSWHTQDRPPQWRMSVLRGCQRGAVQMGLPLGVRGPICRSWRTSSLQTYWKSKGAYQVQREGKLRLADTDFLVLPCPFAFHFSLMKGQKCWVLKATVTPFLVVSQPTATALTLTLTWRHGGSRESGVILAGRHHGEDLQATGRCYVWVQYYHSLSPK